jgi:hypothetical protein
MKTKLLGLMALVTLLGLSPASADTIYTYTGNDFTFASSPYTTTDMVTGTIDLSTALGDNFGPATITPVSFTFSDGVQTISNTTSSLVSAKFLSFSTDALGNIIGWDIDLQTTAGTLLTFNVPGATADGGCEPEGCSVLSTTTAASNVGDAGVWATTPLPAALPLFATGLGALGLLGWRRKRKAQAAA